MICSIGVKATLSKKPTTAPVPATLRKLESSDILSYTKINHKPKEWQQNNDFWKPHTVIAVCSAARISVMGTNPIDEIGKPLYKELAVLSLAMDRIKYITPFFLQTTGHEYAS